MSPLSVRPVQAADLPALRPWLAPGADAAWPAEGHGEAWLLACRGAQPLACLRVRSRIGQTWPRHWYHVGCVVHAVPTLELYHRQTTLLLGSDHTGASELADFAWAPALDAVAQTLALRALLQAAGQHMDARRDAHAGPVIFELPGWRDPAGRSPFWQGLGRHFYDADLPALARQHGPHWRSDLALLLPRQPLYTAFLPEPAQAAIAQAAAHARSWMTALSDAGFRYSHHIDIVDGGPVFEAHLNTWDVRQDA